MATDSLSFFSHLARQSAVNVALLKKQIHLGSSIGVVSVAVEMQSMLSLIELPQVLVLAYTLGLRMLASSHLAIMARSLPVHVKPARFEAVRDSDSDQSADRSALIAESLAMPSGLEFRMMAHCMSVQLIGYLDLTTLNQISIKSLKRWICDRYCRIKKHRGWNICASDRMASYIPLVHLQYLR
jgi:hypothetical protein